MKKLSLINLITTLLLNLVTILYGFIVPKIILSYFGSEVNGLITSLTQLLSYVSLVEGGISGVVIASLYKPLYEKDNEKISSIIKTTNVFYRKIGIISIIYSILVLAIYPFIVENNFSYMYIFTLGIILTINIITQYMFSLTMRNLLMADKKIYIISITKILMMVFSILLIIISVNIYPNVHILNLIGGLMYLLQPIVFGIYLNKNYKIDKKAKLDNELLKNRWNGFAVNIAAFIHGCTDVVLLTLFTNLKTVSIYSVYSLVITGLKQIISAIEKTLTPTVGQAYAKGNMKELNNKMNMFEYIIFLSVFFLFILGGLLITPFVMIYTKDVVDINYYQPLFGILILIAEGIYLIKIPHLALAYSANKFKEIRLHCYIEAGINILVSIILVQKVGLIGVAIGTICGMLYRSIYQILFTKTMIKDRDTKETFKKIGIFILAGILGICICILIIPKIEYTIFSWIKSAIIYAIVIGIDYYIVSKIFFKEEFNSIKKYLLKK